MHSETYDIQQLITASGTPRRTIYFYVQQGLLLPPNGAGLAAHYTEDHLLRLRLIPVLRAQGLRLDEIRERFAHMSSTEMQALLQEAASRAPAPTRGPADVQPIIKETRGWAEQPFIHYQLPAGISLVAPSTLDPADRQRLDLLLQAARQIFGPPPSYIAMDSGNNHNAPRADQTPGPADDDKPYSA